MPLHGHTPSRESRALVLRGGRFLTPEGWVEGDLRVVDGVIQGDPEPGTVDGSRRRESPEQVFELEVGGRTVVPGFIDPHVHGAMGADFATADDSGIHTILAYLARVGVTGCLATLRSDTPAALAAAVERLARYRPQPGEAALLGIHLEGPYLAPAAAGAQDPDRLRLPDPDEFASLLERAGGRVRMITLAPELDGALDLIEMASARGVRVALGHSSCTLAQAQEAVERGASQVTHLFNGMRAWHHREPGLAGAALTDGRLAVHIIADGVHVHPTALRMAWQATRAGAARRTPRLALMSDGSDAMGLGDGRYTRPDGREVHVQGGKAVLAGSGAIAGGTQSLHQATRNLRRWGFPEREVFEAASTVIAGELGLKKGRIIPGGDGDLVVLDPEWNVTHVIVGGEVAYASDHHPTGGGRTAE